MEIRLYKPDDYNSVIELCKFIWEGNDYLPHVINDYYQSPHCKPYVLIEDNKVVSVANANFFTKDFVWFQSIRTHPDYRSKGLGTKLSNFMMEEVKKVNGKEIWLSTSSNNEATAKMLSKQGFTNPFNFSLWHFDYEESDKETISQNKGLFDGSLVDLTYLQNHITDEVINLANYWKIVETKDELKELDKKDFFLFSEFIICPADSYFIEDWIINKCIFKNKKTGTIAVISESKEHDNVVTLGVSKSSENDILSILYYTTQHLSLDNKILKLFYHNDDDLPILPNPRVFKIMKKKLT